MMVSFLRQMLKDVGLFVIAMGLRQPLSGGWSSSLQPGAFLDRGVRITDQVESVHPLKVNLPSLI